MTEADYLTIINWLARNTLAGKRSTVVTKRPVYFDLNRFQRKSQGKRQLSVQQMGHLLSYRRQQTSLTPLCLPSVLQTATPVPVSLDEWFDFLQARLVKASKGTPVGTDSIPNELYSVSAAAG